MKITGILMLAALGMATCGEKQQDEPVITQDPTEALIEANRNRVRQERTAIDTFIEQKNWPVDTTGTGLRYWIYETGEGPQAAKGQLATIDYSVRLLNDSLIYTSADKGPIDFRIGQDHIESGLHEGILFMRLGGKARFVMPSHLAHGFTGDFSKVSGNTPLVYDIHLIELR